MASGSSVGGGVFPDTQQGPSTAAGDGAGANSQEPTQKKRKPILTLKTERVFSEKGLRYVEKEFPKLKFKGKGHEVGALLVLLNFCVCSLVPRPISMFFSMTLYNIGKEPEDEASVHDNSGFTRTLIMLSSVIAFSCSLLL